jgi:uncharacterized protein involved in outer membrane biogenesis
MKRVIWVAGGLCAIALLLLVVLLPVLIDLEPLKARWLPVAERTLGRHLTVGHVRLSLLPPIGVTLEELAIMDDPAFGGQPFLTVDAVTVRPALWPLLRREIEISTLTVTHPSLLLIRRADGRWNYQSLKPDAVPDPSSPAGPAGPSTEPSMVPPALQMLRLINGTVTVRDQRAGAGPAPMAVDRINLSIDHLQLGEATGLNGSAHVDGWPAPVTLSGRVRLAPTAPNFIADADLSVQLGKSDVRLTAHPDRERPAGSGVHWIVRIESTRLDLDELLARPEPAGAPAVVAAGVVSTTRATSGPPASDAAPWSGEVTAELTIGAVHLHQLTINDLRASGRMHEGTVRLETVTGRLAGGAVEAKGTVNLARADRPFDAEAAASRIDLQSVQRGWSPSKPRMTGTATVSTSLNGVMGTAWKWEETVKGLKGRGQLDIRDGAVEGIDLVGTITQQLNKLAGRADANAPKRDRTPFSSATATVTLGQGIASIGSFQVESDEFSLSASGRVGLTSPQPLGLKAEMRLSEPVSRALPAKSAVALLSDRGRLAIPVLIKGTVADPLILPDAELLAKRTGKRLSERVLNEVMSNEVDQLRETGKSLFKGLLGR